MRAAFWHERWEKGEIGFHQADFNAHMQTFVGQLGVQPGGHILVPLCGKSLDLLWLLKQGYQVTGIEISERAVRDFFAENHLAYEVLNDAGATIFRGESIEIWCADFFKVIATDLPTVDAVYDRASLVALPPEMRPAYARHLASLMQSDTGVLLVTLDYPQTEMKGPPFSVTGSEVEQLFGRWYQVASLWSEDCLANEPRFRKKGLTRLDEHVFLLRKNRPSEMRLS
jgi:thiopurine S-methyltransferase